MVNPGGMHMPGVSRGVSDLQKMQMMQMNQMKPDNPLKMSMPGNGMQNQTPQQQQQQQQMMMQQKQQQMMMMQQKQQQMMMMQQKQQQMMMMQNPMMMAKQQQMMQQKKEYPKVTSEKIRQVKPASGTEAMLFYSVNGVNNAIKINRARPVVTMGRHTEVDIRLNPNDTSISRFHATIMTVVSDDETTAKFIFKDTSQFGSFINGEKTSECELRDGSRIRLGTSNVFIYFVSTNYLFMMKYYLITFIYFITNNYI